MSENQAASSRRRLRGRVVSNRMDKTIIVAVERRFKHPKYRKYVARTKRYAAHDETNACAMNDVVVIEESRPLSKTKRWVVVERIEA